MTDLPGPVRVRRNQNGLESDFETQMMNLEKFLNSKAKKNRAVYEVVHFVTASYVKHYGFDAKDIENAVNIISCSSRMRMVGPGYANLDKSTWYGLIEALLLAVPECDHCKEIPASIAVTKKSFEDAKEIQRNLGPIKDGYTSTLDCLRYQNYQQMDIDNPIFQTS